MTQNTTTTTISPKEKTYDMVIVGGGISGLSMAYLCAKQSWSVLLLEAAPQVGGALHSQAFKAPAEDFWVELGAHSCFNSYGHLIRILEDLGALSTAQKKATATFRFWREEKMRSIPSQLSWLPLFATLPKLFTEKKAGRTVKDYYTCLFGETNYQHVFKHAFNAVICQAADEFPAEQLFRKKARRKDVLKSFTFPQGLQSIAQAISTLPQIELQTQTPVKDICFSNAVFSIKTKQQVIHSRFLTLATPVNVTKKLLEYDFYRLSQCLETLYTVEVESVGVLVKKADINLEPLAGVIAPDNAFYSLVSRDTVKHKDYRGFTVHFKAQKLPEADKRQLICKVLGIENSAILDWVEKTNVLPALRLEHESLLQNLDEQLKELPLAITGNYFNGVSIEDCVTRSVVEFERLRAF